MNETSDPPPAERLLYTYYGTRKEREEIDDANKRRQAFLAALPDQEYIALRNVLMDDVQSAVAIRLVHDSGFARRAIIRSVFAFVEATISTLRQEVQIRLDHGIGAPLAPEEILALRELTPYIDDKGKVKTSRKFSRPLPAARMTFISYCKVNEIQCPLTLSGPDWDHFESAIELRNRITHPKKLAEIEVSEAELDSTLVAYKWFKSLSTALMEAKIAALRNDL